MAVLPVEPASMGRVSAALDRARPMLLARPKSPLMLLLLGARCPLNTCPSPLALRFATACPAASRRKGSSRRPPGLPRRLDEDLRLA